MSENVLNTCEIKIEGAFYLVSDNCSWKVSEKKKRKNKEGEIEYYFDHQLHYSTVVGALEGYKRKMLRESGSKTLTELTEAKQRIWKRIDKSYKLLKDM